MGNPPLMLMDEPFGAIDPIVRTRLQDELLRLQQEVRKTVVFARCARNCSLRRGAGPG
jgi:ABC-type proline/glycine betaine transport system ATPase subunit